MPQSLLRTMRRTPRIARGLLGLQDGLGHGTFARRLVLGLCGEDGRVYVAVTIPIDPSKRKKKELVSHS